MGLGHTGTVSGWSGGGVQINQFHYFNFVIVSPCGTVVQELQCLPSVLE